MPKLALGIIETVGLAAGIEAADAAVKSANVTLIGYELSKGGGMVTIKLEGDVGAVKAAVDAAVAAAQKVSSVFSKQVIPRPHDEIEKIIFTKETVGLEKEEKKNEDEASSKPEAESEPESDPEPEIEPETEGEPELEEALVLTGQASPKPVELDLAAQDSSVKKVATCNLCHDPKCPRIKGDLKSTCIHYEELKEV